MSNQNTKAAQAYHEATKLTYINLRNKPPLYKSYIGLPVVSLPTTFSTPQAPTLAAVAADGRVGDTPLDLSTVAQLLFFSVGLVKKAVLPISGEISYRAAASAGALYPVETYLVCQEIPGLEAGVYHFSPAEFALRQLRKGDYRGELVGAMGGDQDFGTAPAVLIFTAIFWRSAWKYRGRSYRYCLWDNGTIVANLLATASAVGLTTRTVAGFIDDRVNRLLGIRREREAALCLVPIGKGGWSYPVLEIVDLTHLPVEAENEATGEINYPEIHRMHAASALTTQEEVAAWRGGLILPPPQAQGLFYPLQTKDGNDVPSRRLGEVILRRGSSRRFAREVISYSQFSTILDSSTKAIQADFLGQGSISLLDIYIIVNAVEGLPSGAYFFCPGRHELELLREGAFREEAGHLCFEQALGADASAVVFFMADLGRILERYGNRGYRAAQLEAGIRGGKIYLCAHSLGLGASGLTFYDEEVTDFFSSHATGKSTMFVVALGVTAQPNQVRPFRSRIAMVLDALARGAGM